MLSDDDVVDYMVMEAVALKVAHEDGEATRKAEREKFKKDTRALDQYR